MRTVVENRHGISPESRNDGFRYEHREVPGSPVKKLGFVFMDDAKPSKFIQDLMDKFCK